MTLTRLTLDQINSDQLDALYDQLDRAQRVALRALDQDEPATDPELRRQLTAAIKALGASETENADLRRALVHCPHKAPLERVTALYEQWVKAGPPPLGTSINRWWDRRLAELHAAIQPPDRCPQCGATSQCPLHTQQPKEQ